MTVKPLFYAASVVAVFLNILPAVFFSFGELYVFNISLTLFLAISFYIYIASRLSKSLNPFQISASVVTTSKYLDLFVYIFYLPSIATRIIGFFRGLSLYAMTASEVHESSFISRIFTFMIPQGFWIILATIYLLKVFLKDRNRSKYVSANTQLSIYSPYLIVSFLFLSKLLSSSVSSLANILTLYWVLSYIIYGSIIPFSSTWLKPFLRRFTISYRKALFVVAFVLFLVLIFFMSFNRGGSILYMINLVAAYAYKVSSYSSSIFSYFYEHQPAYCGLQSSFILYFINLLPLAQCRASFRAALEMSDLEQKGSWLGMLGAHSIDVGSQFASLSFVITAILFSYLLYRLTLVYSNPTFRIISSIVALFALISSILFFFSGLIFLNIIIPLSSIFILYALVRLRLVQVLTLE